MIITGTYSLVANPNWAQLPLQEIYLECDTTTAPVVINLFEIATLNRFWNVKIYISDVSNNCSVNNITVNVGGSDVIDGSGLTSVALTVNGSALTLSVVNESLWMSSESTGLPLTPYQTNVYYVDPLRTDIYTPTGGILFPFKTMAAAISAAETAGYSDAEPAYIVLSGNITENITLTKGGIWLTSAFGTGTHGSPNITGTITINGAGASLSANHFSIANLRIIAPAGANGVESNGTNPQKIFMKDIWIDANGTKACVLSNNTGVGSTCHLNTAHLTHSGTGDIYCIDVTHGTVTMTDIETSGNVQVAAVRAGTTLTLDSSEIDANNDSAIEVYGGTLIITKSTITNAKADSNGIALNTAGSVAIIGDVLFSIPVGTGKAVYGVVGTALFYQFVTFINPANPAIAPNRGISATVSASALPTTFV